MRKRKAVGAALLSLGLMVSGMTLSPVYADGTKVVTLGADLSDAQKQTMMKYFKVNANEAQIITITNQDERNHLSGYVPLEQIGTRTVSCAYVKPTNSGGIKVRTANLNWVTGNMIASSLSTSGVKNCEVIAACPFEVSGTGALTGVQMAYETATGTTLEESKKNLATQEIVVTGNLAEEVGRADAVALINDSKIDVIQNEITEHTEITNIVNNVANNNNVLLTQEQLDQITDFLQQIAEENYNYEDVAETLETIEANTSAEEEPETEQNAEAQQNAEAEPSTEAEAEPEPEQAEEYDADSILNDIDESVLGENIVTSSTEDQSLEEQTYEAEDTEEEWETFPQESEGDSSVVIEEVPEDQAEAEPSSEAGGESVSIEEFETEGAEEAPAAEQPEAAEETPAEEETSVREAKIAALSEQARSQYEDAVKFAKGEFGGDTQSLTEVMDWEFTPSLALNERLDAEKLQKFEDQFTDAYLNILADGTSSYVPTGEEQYLNVELCMMDEYLKKLFAINGAALDASEEDLLTDLLPEEKESLYRDALKFFEKLYGETSETETFDAEETAEEYETYEENTDSESEGENYYEEESSEGEQE